MEGRKGLQTIRLMEGLVTEAAHPNRIWCNTLHALEALYYSRKSSVENSTPASDLNWAAAIQFIQNCQHLPKNNKQEWVSNDPKDVGGFIYSPDSSKAEETDSAGRKALRAYGASAVCGDVSYIYAGLKPEDPRVKAVLEWATGILHPG